VLEPIRPGEAQRAMQLLDPRDAQVLEMLLGDAPLSEIAVALSVPPASVWQRISDILDRLSMEPLWSAVDKPCDRPAA
jgi:DNA-directed RNA polymerase specialized sigma24 family protein